MVLVFNLFGRNKTRQISCVALVSRAVLILIHNVIFDQHDRRSESHAIYLLDVTLKPLTMKTHLD